ncbi:hypothetical protein FQN50_001723 [Emmonsiellopsis sp. PD_5]|nr:hypothetical protein FQN50_001723 [Emmonsiellopsis sp. PD_5]
MAETEWSDTLSDVSDDWEVTRQGIATLLNSEKYSDCKITCQGQTFNAHKAIVCTKSPVISAAMDGQSPVCQHQTPEVCHAHEKQQEATISSMALDQFNLGIVKRMLIYLYTEEYEVFLEDWVVVGTGIDPNTDLDDYDDLSIHIQMHAIADYLEIPELREHALDMVNDVFDSGCPCPRFVAAMREILEVMVDAAAARIDELNGCEESDRLKLSREIIMGILRSVVQSRAGVEPEAEAEAEAESEEESEEED